MRILALTFLLVGPTSLAADRRIDPRALAETVRRLGLPEEQVRKDAIQGCESGKTLDMNICAEYGFVVADLRMNDLYAQVVGHLKDPKNKELLRKSQLAWLGFRDAACKFDSAGFAGGTLRPMNDLACRQTLTEERSRHLEEYVSCTPSDNCPE
jgi:uncharacterized protein YecT (DUF1311 family)